MTSNLYVRYLTILIVCFSVSIALGDSKEPDYKAMFELEVSRQNQVIQDFLDMHSVWVGEPFYYWSETYPKEHEIIEGNFKGSKVHIYPKMRMEDGKLWRYDIHVIEKGGKTIGIKVTVSVYLKEWS